jgi:hypothetical protein
MLRTFLEDELSESYLGLPTGARSHLERFRTFLFSFYTVKFGYYPPPTVDKRTAIFRAEVYNTMREDFESLYELLVDESFTSADGSPFLAQGGICTVQSVHSFDLRFRFKSLRHPLPLLPEVTTATNSRRLSWFTRTDKLKPDQRLLAHAAQIKASNSWKNDLLGNDLVRAYRKFEEESIVSPLKVDKHERLSLVDGRKVRWILIYSLYQVLKNASSAPPEVHNVEESDYILAVSTTNLPPWRDANDVHPLLRRSTAAHELYSGDISPDAVETPSSFSAAIKPDIDYFAMTHHHTEEQAPAIRPSRSRSLTRSLSRNGTIRRSLSLFRNQRYQSPAAKSHRSPYHEIVVHGYGNGTNVVNISNDSPSILPNIVTTNRSPSTASNSTTSGCSVSDSTATTPSTAPSSAPPTSPKTAFNTIPLDASQKSLAPTNLGIPERGRSREATSSPPRRTDPALPRYSKRPASMFDSMSPASLPYRNYATTYEDLVDQQRQSVAFLDCQMLPANPSKGLPLSGIAIPDNPDAWNQLGGPRQNANKLSSNNDVQTVWEQFADLGGHTIIAPLRLKT